MKQQTRTALSIITTITLGTLAGVMLWATGAFFAAETYAIAFGGVFATVAMLALFSVALVAFTRRLRKRGYARPVLSGNVLESAVRVLRHDEHPVKARQTITVNFDDGTPVLVDVAELYYLLIRSGSSTVLPWHQVRNKMSRREWQAHRHLLDTAGVVDVDGRGAMRLNCSAWSAVEKVRG